MNIAIVTMTAGAGHLQAASAIQEVLRLAGGHTVEVMDVLSYTSRLNKAIVSKGYVKLIGKSPELWSYLFKATDSPVLLTKYAKLRRNYDKLVNKKFFRHLAEFQPEVIVATHFMGLDILGQDFPAKFYCVITDFEAHGLWISPEVDHYFVATDRTRGSLVARGVAEARIEVTGIPIHPKYQAVPSRKEACRKLALREDIPAVLLLGGGFGMGPIAETLEQFDHYPDPLQVLVVTGRNERLRKTLASKAFRQPVRLTGFVDNMQDYLSAADLVVSKPGGLTTSECLALGRPMLIFNPIPGQESANSDFLLEKGAAVKVNRVQDIAPVVADALLPGNLKRLKVNAKKLGRPLAANAICERILAGV